MPIVQKDKNNRDVAPWAFNERRSILSAMLVGKKPHETVCSATSAWLHANFASAANIFYN